MDQYEPRTIQTDRQQQKRKDEASDLCGAGGDRQTDRQSYSVIVIVIVIVVAAAEMTSGTHKEQHKASNTSHPCGVGTRECSKGSSSINKINEERLDPGDTDSDWILREGGFCETTRARHTGSEGPKEDRLPDAVQDS